MTPHAGRPNGRRRVRHREPHSCFFALQLEHDALHQLTSDPLHASLLSTHPFYVDALAPDGCCRAVRRREGRAVGQC